MNLFRPVPNANEKQPFCQIVKIVVFNKCPNGWHMRKNSQKTLKNTEKRREPGGKRGGKQKKQKNSVFFHLTTWQGTYCKRPALDRGCAIPFVSASLYAFRLVKRVPIHAYGIKSALALPKVSVPNYGIGFVLVPRSGPLPPPIVPPVR